MAVKVDTHYNNNIRIKIRQLTGGAPRAIILISTIILHLFSKELL